MFIFSGLYIIFYLIVTTSFAGISVPYNALIADKSHPTQRGNYYSLIMRGSSGSGEGKSQKYRVSSKQSSLDPLK